MLTTLINSVSFWLCIIQIAVLKVGFLKVCHPFAVVYWMKTNHLAGITNQPTC